LELKFYTVEDATKYIQAQKIYVANKAFLTAPKIVVPLKIYIVYKTINPKHRPGSCTSIPCGKCSGDHASKHYAEMPGLFRGTFFQQMPQEKMACKNL
jgi:hypothetical protein